MTKLSRDELGDRMKAYEFEFAGNTFDSQLPIYARIDGRTFSRFTKGMKKPFDPRMSEIMIQVTEDLVRETKARMAYVQSDEISLVWLADRPESEAMFGGKQQKLCSVLASIAAGTMTRLLRGWEPYEDRPVSFDCRVVQFPDKTEAANMFLWRSQDAVRNAVSSACRSVCSHKEMQNKTVLQMRELVEERGVDFEEYPESFKAGTFVTRITEDRTLTEEELLKIPEHKRADLGTGVFQRHKIVRVHPGPLHEVANREAFIFEGEEPVYHV